MPTDRINGSSCLIRKTAFGYAALAYRTDPFGLLRIYLPRATQKELRAKIQGAHQPRRRHPSQAVNLANLVDNYFLGQRFNIPWEFIDFTQHTPKQSKIYRTVAKIPYGQVRSYGEVAESAGMPLANRFVGNCMASNPYPIIIPCHRVVRGDGSLGGFGGGLGLKRRMLDLESRARLKTP